MPEQGTPPSHGQEGPRPASGSTLEMPADFRREADELLRYYGEIVRRMGQGGISDIASLLATYEQLQRALETVSAQELVWADERARRLIEKLNGLLANLEVMRRLKASFGDAGEGSTSAGPFS